MLGDRVGTVIPGFVVVTQHGEWPVTEPREVAALGGACCFLIDGYDPREEPRDLVDCVESGGRVVRAPAGQG